MQKTTQETKTQDSPKLRVAILGSGNIGTDLLIKIRRSPYLEAALFIGRNLASPGMVKAHSLGVPISDQSIDAIVQDPDCCDLVFDATSATDAKRHWQILERLGKTVIDMTPAKVGAMCVPAVNLKSVRQHPNLNMITCGGQASIPIAHLIGQTQPEIEYIETVSSIASRSAGPATRINIDEYVETTENAIQAFSGAKHAKAILILNPAQPCIDMQTTVFAKVADPDIAKLRSAIGAMVQNIQTYVPGYQMIVEPTLEGGRIIVTVKVQGLGDYLPKYAGNLDIINCAAIAAAEEFARERFSAPSGRTAREAVH
jgi:acetaldehyde dehydrogenase (acetylating)